MRRALLVITLAVIPAAALVACRPPTAARGPGDAVGPPRSARLPEPGVYVLQRIRGLALPADLKPGGIYDRFERMYGGRLYVAPDSTYQTIFCSTLVDTAGRVVNPLYGGGWEGRYWVAGGRVYFSEPVADGPQDSTVVRVQGDTVEFLSDVFVRDHASVRPRYTNRLSVCPAIRASSARGRPPGT